MHKPEHIQSFEKQKAFRFGRKQDLIDDVLSMLVEATFPFDIRLSILSSILNDNKEIDTDKMRQVRRRTVEFANRMKDCTAQGMNGRRPLDPRKFEQQAVDSLNKVSAYISGLIGTLNLMQEESPEDTKIKEVLRIIRELRSRISQMRTRDIGNNNIPILFELHDRVFPNTFHKMHGLNKIPKTNKLDS